MYILYCVQGFVVFFLIYFFKAVCFKYPEILSFSMYFCLCLQQEKSAIPSANLLYLILVLKSTCWFPEVLESSPKSELVSYEPMYKFGMYKRVYYKVDF